METLSVLAEPLVGVELLLLAALLDPLVTPTLALEVAGELLVADVLDALLPFGSKILALLVADSLLSLLALVVELAALELPLVAEDCVLLASDTRVLLGVALLPFGSSSGY